MIGTGYSANRSGALAGLAEAGAPEEVGGPHHHQVDPRQRHQRAHPPADQELPPHGPRGRELAEGGAEAKLAAGRRDGSDRAGLRDDGSAGGAEPASFHCNFNIENGY